MTTQARMDEVVAKLQKSNLHPTEEIKNTTREATSAYMAVPKEMVDIFDEGTLSSL